MYHDPTPCVYEKIKSDDGRIHIRFHRKASSKKAVSPRLSRRDKALLIADIKQGIENPADWPVARLAEVFNASKRSAFAALKLSPEERDAIRDNQRPLFQHQPTSLITAAEHLRLAVDAIGVDAILVKLIEIEKAMKVAA